MGSDVRSGSDPVRFISTDRGRNEEGYCELEGVKRVDAPLGMGWEIDSSNKKDNMNKYLFLVILGVFVLGTAGGQELTDTTVVYYHHSRSDIDMSLRDNKAALDDLVKYLEDIAQDSTRRMNSIRLDSYASPDGLSTANKALSWHRAERMREYIGVRVGLPDSVFTLTGHGVDWSGLAKIVSGSDVDVPYKNEVIDILRNTPEWIFDNKGHVVDSRKRRLGMLRGGIPYNYLLKHVFPLLRRSCVTLYYVVDVPEPRQPFAGSGAEGPIAEPDTCVGPATPLVTEPAVVPAPEVNVSDERTFRPMLSVKTNLLYWVGIMPDLYRYTFVPNLEVEWFIGDRWSLAGVGNYAKWGYGDDDFYGISSWSIESRWWLKGDGRFRWFYVGVYGQMGDYDAQNSRIPLDGSTGKLWGAGLSIGAAIPFSDRFGLEIGIRGGYRHSVAKGYVHEAPEYFLEYKGNDGHWGITGLKSSLYFRFGKGNKR